MNGPEIARDGTRRRDGIRTRPRFKVLLPIVLGSVSASLMAWDIHNQFVIRSVGMGWDTGAPLWPYQTAAMLFSIVNFPAYFIAGPVVRIFDLLVPNHYFALFPATLLWWWFVGTYLDKIRTESRPEKARLRRWLFLIAAVVFFALGLTSLIDAFRWWFTYSRVFVSITNLIMLRVAAPAPWCLILSFVAAKSANLGFNVGA